ncbi:MAG: hypothetical protein Q9214_004780, partial [Letrouitia sp. 1 TL-2023]
MNRFSKDVEAMDQEVASIAVGMLSCVFSVIIIVILISAITPAFLIAGLFIAAIYIAVGAFYLRSSVDLKRLESIQRSPLYQQFGETLSGIITIRAYGHERRFTQDNLRRIDTHNRPFIYLWATNRWLAFRVDILGALVSFFAGAFVLFQIKSIDAGAAGLSMTYAVMFSENVLWLVRLYSMNEQNMNSVERIKEYLDVEQEAKAVIPETRPPGNWPSHGAIQFINYSTRYRDDLDPVLKNVTFNIQPGERVGIVGRTGAGKSSLALALFRGLEATEGKIVIDDVDIGLIGLQDLRGAITIVPQDPTLFTGTIRSNLDPFGLFTDEEIFATLRRVQLIGAEPPSRPNTAVYAQTGTSSSSSTDDEPSGTIGLAKTFTNTRENANLFESLSSAVAESGSNISQGQRQLLCLARALLKAPRVLLMDEATASIDYATDSKIQGTLREVKGSTIITIAHRLQTIIDYDKILVLEKGKVVEFDAPWRLIAVEGGIFHGMCEKSGDMETLAEEARRASTKKSAQVTVSPLVGTSGPTSSLPSTCLSRSINYITHSLPQQCLASPRVGKLEEIAPERSATDDHRIPDSVTVVSREENHTTPIPYLTDLGLKTSETTITQIDSSQPNGQSPHTSSMTSGVQPPTGPVPSSETVSDTENDSPLDNANFLSFEEWKKQNLEKAGQSAENVGSGRGASIDPKRRHAGINNALDSLGEDAEIEIDFGGFVSSEAATQPISSTGRSPANQKPIQTSRSSNERYSERPSSSRMRSKDAGKTCKERSNYASFDCAATVLKTNPESKGATYVLLENKDSYMLNECTAKNKFLIVELCDNILIDTIVLANYEFFSSIFRTFRVSVSDRYPVRIDKWRDLGEFEARNAREVQAFLVEEPQIWARYLRIEFLTHFGNEYYCP